MRLPAKASTAVLSRKKKTAHKACKVTEEVYEKIKILIRQELSPQQVVDYMEKHKGIIASRNDLSTGIR